MAAGSVAATQPDPRSTPAPRWMSHQPRYMGCRLKAYGPVETIDSGCSSWNAPAVRRRRLDERPGVQRRPRGERGDADRPLEGSWAGERCRATALEQTRIATTPIADPAGSGRFS